MCYEIFKDQKKETVFMEKVIPPPISVVKAAYSQGSEEFAEKPSCPPHAERLPVSENAFVMQNGTELV